MRGLKIGVVTIVILISWSMACAYVFDAVDVSSKARGMGGAWVASGEDASAIFYNPATLLEVDGTDLYASFLRPNSQDFESLTFVASSFSYTKTQRLALSFRRFSVEYGGQNLLSESTVSAAHAICVMRDLHSALYLSYAVNVYMLSFGETSTQELGSETTFGVDLGFLGVLRDRTRLGLFLKNINEPTVGKIEREPLPQWITAGVSYKPYYGVTTELDVRTVRGEDPEIHLGMQFRVTDAFDVRFGFQTEPHSLTGGFTVRMKMLELDYAYSSHSVLPGTHHISVRGILARSHTR